MKTEDTHQTILPGSMYHIYNRGNNREDIFFEEKNYFFFLQLWKKYINPIADTFAYCLLPNHFHFLIRARQEAGEKQITKNFSNLFNAYAKSMNKAYDRTGSLFQERFRRKSIMEDNNFTQLIFYIHANPQNHGLVKDFTKYIHSSYLSLCSLQPTLLMRKDVLEWFGGREAFIDYHRKYRIALVDQKKLLADVEEDLDSGDIQDLTGF